MEYSWITWLKQSTRKPETLRHLNLIAMVICIPAFDHKVGHAANSCFYEVLFFTKS